MLVHRLKFLIEFLVVAFLYLALCSFNGIQIHQSIGGKNLTDTVPSNELSNLSWNNVTRLVPEKGMLIAQLNNGESLVIARGDYEKYARKSFKPDEYDKTFTKMEIDPEFPGGPDAWAAYLKKNMRYPQEAVAGEIQGVVVVQFIVDTEGDIIGAEAVSGPTTGGLRDEAVRLIKTSGKWNTAIQNFRLVKAYKKQPVLFMLP